MHIDVSLSSCAWLFRKLEGASGLNPYTEERERGGGREKRLLTPGVTKNDLERRMELIYSSIVSDISSSKIDNFWHLFAVRNATHISRSNTIICVEICEKIDSFLPTMLLHIRDWHLDRYVSLESIECAVSPFTSGSNVETN